MGTPAGSDRGEDTPAGAVGTLQGRAAVRVDAGMQVRWDHRLPLAQAFNTWEGWGWGEEREK